MPLTTIEGCIIRKRDGFDSVALVVTEGQQQQHVSVNCQHPSLPVCHVDAIVRIQGQQSDNKLLVAETIDLVQCAPHPRAVPHVLQGVLDGTLPDWTLPLSKGEIQSELESSGRRMVVSKIVRLLKNQGRDPRKQKNAHTKRADFELLDEIEADDSPLWQLRSIRKRALPNGQAVENNHEASTLKTASSSENWVRRVKNQPEIQWITERIAELNCRPKHIVDVGGGRGDLAMNMAARFADSVVTIVDKQDFGAQHHTAVSINFVHSNFTDFMQNSSSYLSSNDLPPIDLVVAFHACGDLSDLALLFAKQQSCSFLVCPCCHTKRCIPDFLPPWQSILATERQVRVLGELTELKDRPHVSKRARGVINSMRLDLMERGWLLHLEEYDSKTSDRNMVLIGEREIIDCTGLSNTT